MKWRPSKNILNGYPDKTFRPDSPITRAELVKMALKGANVAVNENIDCANPLNLKECQTQFEDLDSWQIPYIVKAFQLKIINGYDNFTFKPNVSVTRAEALKIVLLAFHFSPDQLIAAPEKTFKDVNYQIDWFGKYVAYALNQGIISGYVTGNFGINQSMTRAEASKIVALLIK